jgi:hypothetical protein
MDTSFEGGWDLLLLLRAISGRGAGDELFEPGSSRDATDVGVSAAGVPAPLLPAAPTPVSTRRGQESPLVAGRDIGAAEAREGLQEGGWVDCAEEGVDAPPLLLLLLLTAITAEPGRVISAGGMRGAVGNSAEQLESHGRTSVVWVHADAHDGRTAVVLGSSLETEVRLSGWPARSGSAEAEGLLPGCSRVVGRETDRLVASMAGNWNDELA